MRGTHRETASREDSPRGGSHHHADRELASGQWIQDSSDIVDYFEARRARSLVRPEGARAASDERAAGVLRRRVDAHGDHAHALNRT